MRQRSCEVLTYLNWSNLGRFLSDRSKWPAITRAFGGDEWTRVLDLPHVERAAFLLRTYREALKTRGHTKYVWHFAMRGRDNTLIYWLFFCSNSLSGLREMKRAMLRVDDTGAFCFSDKDDPEQVYLFSKCDEAFLANEVYRRLAGATMTVADVAETVLTETPGVYHKPALKILEKQGKLDVLNAADGRRSGTFPTDDLRLRFAPAD